MNAAARLDAVERRLCTIQGGVTALRALLAEPAAAPAPPPGAPSPPAAAAAQPRAWERPAAERLGPPQGEACR